MRGQRRSATRAVRHDLVSFIDKSAVENVFQRPPLGLDIIIVVSDVRVFHIHPVAHAVGHFLPLGLVLPHAFLALTDKRLDTVLLDILFAVHAELLFDFEFDGQTMSIPAGFTRGVIAFHRLETRDNILHDARENMTDMRLAVSGRGSVVEREFFAVLGLFQRFFENAILFPELQHFFFAADEIHIGIDFLVHKVFLLLRRASAPSAFSIFTPKSPCLFSASGPRLARQNALTMILREERTRSPLNRLTKKLCFRL